MTPEEFRDAGHQLIDWIADYRLGVPQGPVRAPVEPGDIKELIWATLDDTGVPIETMLADLDERVVPGVMAMQHPMHFGWFPANASLSSVLGDMASSGLGSLGISWESSPALTELEEVVVERMRELCGLSPGWVGTIHDTASTSALVALMAARERASDYSIFSGGLQGTERPLRVYTTEFAHSSVRKAALLAGYGDDNLVTVPHDPLDYSMDPAALRAAMEMDRDAGMVPAAVVATVGTTGTTAVDPIGEIGAVTQEFGAWLHVDSAMAGSAMLLPEYRHYWAGLDGADSLTWNPHKWMGTILDTSLFYVRDPRHLTSVMATNPAYLRSEVDDEVTQYRDWGIPLGRRFRSLKLWFHLRLDGIETVRDRLRRDIANAQWLAAEVAQTPGWSVLAPVPFQTVCVVYDPGGLGADELDEFTLEWVRRMNESGVAFCSPSTLDGRWMVRVSVGVEATERTHVEDLWRIIRQAAEDRQ